MPTTTQKTTLKKKEELPAPQGQYLYGLGRRKRAVAQVRLYTDKALLGRAVVNGKTIEEYFPVKELRDSALNPLSLVGLQDSYFVSVLVRGGGISGQAGAVSLGIARALEELDRKYHTELKTRGLLTRDPREKERKKYHLKRARKAPQYTKR